MKNVLVALSILISTGSVSYASVEPVSTNHYNEYFGSNVSSFSHRCEVFFTMSYICGPEDYYYDKRGNDLYRIFYNYPSSFDESYE